MCLSNTRVFGAKNFNLNFNNFYRLSTYGLTDIIYVTCILHSTCNTNAFLKFLFSLLDYVI